jgi:hypothetical protein
MLSHDARELVARPIRLVAAQKFSDFDRETRIVAEGRGSWLQDAACRRRRAGGRSHRGDFLANGDVVTHEWLRQVPKRCLQSTLVLTRLVDAG